MSYGQSQFCLLHHSGAHHPFVCQPKVWQPASFCDRHTEREFDLIEKLKWQVCNLGRLSRSMSRAVATLALEHDQKLCVRPMNYNIIIQLHTCT